MSAPFSPVHAIRVQLRVVSALLMREIINRYGRDNLGFVWLFAEPMLFTLGVTALWNGAGMQHGSSIPIVAFAVTGYSAVLLWRNAAHRCSNSIPPNMPLFYHRNVRVLDVFIARITLEIAGASISFVALSALWISLGLMSLPSDTLLALTAWLLLSWYGAALAIIIGALTVYTEVAERFWHPVSYVLFPLSGAVFMVEWLPPDMQKLVLLIPIVHGTEMLREGFFGAAVRTHYDIEYIVGWCLVMTLLGLAMTRDAERRMEILS